MKTFDVEDFEYDPTTKTLRHRALLMMDPLGSIMIRGKTCAKHFMFLHKTSYNDYVYVETIGATIGFGDKEPVYTSFQVILRFM